MKHRFLLIVWCTGRVIAHFNVNFSTSDLGSIFTPRHLRLAVFPRLLVEKRHQKRGLPQDPSFVQQKSAKGGQKNKKTAGQRSKQQQGKGGASSPSQGPGHTNSLQTGKEKNKGSGPKHSEQPKSPGIQPQADHIRAEVNFRGPGGMFWERGNQLQDAQVAVGARGRRVAAHHDYAGAGASSRGPAPPNAALMPASQHPIQVDAQGPIGSTSFIVPEGGRFVASAEIPGRERRTWDYQGPESRRIKIDPLSPGIVKVHASGTPGSWVQASGMSRTHQTDESRSRPG